MTTSSTTTLRLEAHRTTLSDGIGPEMVINVGIDDIVDRLFRHDPPMPREIEAGIGVVEDALAATGLRQAKRGELLTSDPLLHTLLGLSADDARIDREAVEARFQRLASAAFGHTSALAGLSSGGNAAASLLLLRECMHHLGYEGVRRSSV